VAVASISGQASKSSAPFTLQGGQQRITWTCNNEYPGGSCYLYVDPSSAWFAIGHGGQHDQTNAYLDPGTYHLSADSANNSWTLSIEELR
jgi:hypothetical protein